MNPPSETGKFPNQKMVGCEAEISFWEDYSVAKYPSEIPVVIVGAGPTGLTTGLLLARYGVASLILEKNETAMDIPRAIVLDDEGARTFQIFGADAEYLTETVIGDGAEYIDDNGNQIARVGAGAEIYGFAKRYFINQPDMEAALRRVIADEPLVDLRFSSEVTGTEETQDGITVSLTDADGNPHQVRAQYVVAADGGRSPIREGFGLEMAGSTYQQDWIVIDTVNDPDSTNYSHFFCSNERPGVSVPAPKGGRRYEFMLLPGETHEQVLQEAFVKKLVAPYRDLEPKDIIRNTIYTFHARIASKWRIGRILLAGDAAHLTPPFAGQGMNAGLRDATNLAWKLAAVVNGGASDAILDSYEQERRDPAWAMIQLAVIMGDVVMPIDPQQVAFRDQLLEALRPFPAAQDYLLKMKFKPRPRYEAGLFIGLDDAPFEGSIVGEMIPQPVVSDGSKDTKLDELLGPGFALIAQDDAGAKALAALDVDQIAGQPLSRTYLPYVGKSDAMDGVVPCDDHVRMLRTHRDEILLVRPDRYAAAAFRPEQLRDGLAAFARILNP